MPTPFTFNWRVRCKRQSLVDDEIYYVDLGTASPKVVADDLAKELKRLGFINVEVILIETIP